VRSSVLWLRRDLRLRDHPALLAAADDAPVVPLFVIDPRLWEPAGPPRRAWLIRSLKALDAALEGRLVIRRGDPVAVVPAVAAEAGAAKVHVSADAGPYGRARDEAVATALQSAGRALARTGSPYAVGPGTITNGTGQPYKVFTPFFKTWLQHGWPAPAPGPRGVRWAPGVDGERLPAEPDLGALVLPEAGEQAALDRWDAFVQDDLAGYGERRDLPAVNGTSVMSAHLKYGEIHPRTLLAALGRHRSKAAQVYRSELAWREFYADVLWHRPESAREYLRPVYAQMRYADPSRSAAAREHLQAWKDGRTGFPFVDAGMRQLLAEGWMHNRVRMVVASFLVKDLHLEWQLGAPHFMQWLRDGDLASNNHGWQWAAGSGTDAAPYFRVFNPVSQGLTFDPDGSYVRRYVPELRHLGGKDAHQPWECPDGYTERYPERIVDHSAERADALDRFAELRRS
jgi:deoxyribodipyrimidine photo-lyase